MCTYLQDHACCEDAGGDCAVRTLSFHSDPDMAVHRHGHCEGKIQAQKEPPPTQGSLHERVRSSAECLLVSVFVRLFMLVIKCR